MKFALSIVVSLLLITSCGSKHESNVDKGNREKILHVGNGKEPRELDVNTATGSPEHNIILALFEGLVSKDHKTLAPVPGVAKTWNISDDGLVYTFQLRDDAKWSNGDPVQASDFVYAWKRMLGELNGEFVYLLYYVKNAERYHTKEIKDFSEVGIEALSPTELKVTLENPTHFFLQLLDHYSYYPVHPPTIEKFNAFNDPHTKWTHPGNMVSNGPFTLKKWEVNHVIEVEKNPHYWDKENIHLNGIHFYPIVEFQTEERAFRSKQIHLTITPQMAFEKIAVYKRDKPELIRIVPAYSSYYYEFNTEKAPFDNSKVRRAFAMAIDRKLLVENVTKGGEVPAYSLIPNDPEGFSPQQHFEFNPEKARALLAEAGFPNGEGFPTTELLYNTDENHRKVALTVQQMLKKNLNVDIQLLNQEWKVYLNSRRNLEHDISRAGWIADYVDPSNFAELMMSTSGQNNTAWKNQKYDELMKQIQSAPTQQQRFELFEQANKMLAEHMPVIPLYYYSDINLVHKSVKNWYDNVMHYHVYRNVKLVADESDSE